jgi:hypothetical protein
MNLKGKLKLGAVRRRCSIQDEYLQITTTLQEIMLPLKRTETNTSNSSFAGHSNCTHPGYTSRSIHFSPYHPEETITNFIRWLEVFSHKKTKILIIKIKCIHYYITLLLNCINNFMIFVPIMIVVSVIEEYLENLDVF